jgi:hypothetical protein
MANVLLAWRVFGFSDDSSLLRANYDGFIKIDVSKHDKKLYSISDECGDQIENVLLSLICSRYLETQLCLR